MLTISDLWKFNTHLAPARNTVMFLCLPAEKSLAHLAILPHLPTGPQSADKWKGSNGLKKTKEKTQVRKEDNDTATEAESGVRPPQAKERQWQQELGKAKKRCSLERPGSAGGPAKVCLPEQWDMVLFL